MEKAVMRFFWILPAFLGFAACSFDSSSSYNLDGGEKFGWRKDEFCALLHESGFYGGLQGIFHVGDRIVLMDNYMSVKQDVSSDLTPAPPDFCVFNWKRSLGYNR